MTSTNETECPHLTSDITYSVAGKKIYRDQCLKCYDDAVNNNYFIILKLEKWNRNKYMFKMFFRILFKSIF